MVTGGYTITDTTPGGDSLAATTVRNTAGANTISAPIVGTTGVEVDGGTLTLWSTNSYTGATNVNAGTLLVNGSIASSSLTTIAAGATLKGSGTVGALAVFGTVAPGNSVESLGGRQHPVGQRGHFSA